jgi:hypothetical protein
MMVKKSNLLSFIFIFSLVYQANCSAQKFGPICIFIHVCTINHWDKVLERQLDLIKTSGLYKKSDYICLGVLGEGDISPFTAKYPKISVLFQNPDITLYERPTLLKMHELCRFLRSSLILYLHTKGVSRRHQDSNITDWSRYMEYFAIECWRDCVRALKENDACGVNWRAYPSPHFSGNFWWATGNYIASLPSYIGKGYCDPEMWIGLSSPRVKCFQESFVNHYTHPYPESKYKAPTSQ